MPDLEMKYDKEDFLLTTEEIQQWFLGFSEPGWVIGEPALARYRGLCIIQLEKVRPMLEAQQERISRILTILEGDYKVKHVNVTSVIKDMLWLRNQNEKLRRRIKKPEEHVDREALYLKLALWERDGKPVLPGLKEDCSLCWGKITLPEYKDKICTPCDSRGWVPVCNVDVLEQGLYRAGYDFEVYTKRGSVKTIRSAKIYRDLSEWFGTSDTLESALLLAAVAVREKGKKYA